MLISPEVMLFCVYLCLFLMPLMAVFFLRGRKMTIFEYLLWGLVALLLPVLGPYLVIASRPGQVRSL
jgi:thiamine transporter ThiT